MRVRAFKSPATARRPVPLARWQTENETERGLSRSIAISPLKLKKRTRGMGATVHRASMRNKFRAPKIVAPQVEME